MSAILVELYECRDKCHLIFAVEVNKNVTCCPQCGTENPTCVGGGTIKEIYEH